MEEEEVVVEEEEETVEEETVVEDGEEEGVVVEEEVLELDEWFFQDVKYLIDESNNILYSYQTHERVGKKVDEFNIQLF